MQAPVSTGALHFTFAATVTPVRVRNKTEKFASFILAIVGSVDDKDNEFSSFAFHPLIYKEFIALAQA